MNSKKHNASKFSNWLQFCKTCMPQEFLLPLPIMKYVWMHPLSTNAYQKLVKCCKLFFVKNPILVINFLYYISPNWKYSHKNNVNIYRQGNQHKIDMGQISSKIWIIKKLSIDGGFTGHKFPNAVSDFIPKIYQCEFEQLSIFNYTVSYNELKVISPTVKECFFMNVFFNYDNNGEQISLQNIIQLFSSAQKIFILFSSLSKTLCKSYANFIDTCKAIKKIELSSVPDDFDVPEFFRFLKKSKSRVSFGIYSENDADRIKGVADEILQTKFFDFVPPVIYYRGIDKEKLNIMKEIQAKEAAKYH